MTGGPFYLRVAGPADAGAVTAVLDSAYGGLMAPHYDPAILPLILPSMASANPRLLASGTYFVQEAPGGQIVSCGGWTHEEPGTNRIETGIAHVRHFGTHMDWTRQGLGAGIFARCRREALAAGVHTLRSLASLGAEPFYIALGFRAVERIDLTMRGQVTFPAMLMVRAAS